MSEGKPELHPRNRHRDRYDFPDLIQGSPELSKYVAKNAYGDESVDFTDPKAVLALNRAILKRFYGVAGWDIPAQYLCPPIPGRADYVHHLADLLGSGHEGGIPRGPKVRILDIGVGASCVYPIIAQSEYGWSFVGSDIDSVALSSAQRILDANPTLRKQVELRLQRSPLDAMKGVVKPGETFDAVICNPPFHSSPEEAQDRSRRKWRNLGKTAAIGTTYNQTPVLNFGGQSTELWCEGGEAAFVRRMVEESAQMPSTCLWYTSLVSRDTNLPGIYGALDRAGAVDGGTMEMAQGQKKSRIVAWTFLKREERDEWRKKRGSLGT